MHGDIFVAGPRERVLKIGALLEEGLEARDQMIGPGPGDLKELHILNRALRWCKDRLVFVADVRHAKEMIEELALAN